VIVGSSEFTFEVDIEEAPETDIGIAQAVAHGAYRQETRTVTRGGAFDFTLPEVE
jgi:hypothetical protein